MPTVLSSKTQTKPSATSSASDAEVMLYTPVRPNAGALRIGFVYPADTNIAMASLGYLFLFKQLDTHPNVAVTRIALDTLDRYAPNDFDMLAFSFSFELDILNILKILNHWKFPFYSEERDLNYPLLFAGGPVPMTNPEPYAPFFDFFLIGEGEDILNDLVNAVAERPLGTFQDKPSLLTHLAQSISGLYAPSLYEVTYHPEDLTVAAIAPKEATLPFPIRKRFMDSVSMDRLVSASPILTANAYFGHNYLVEVMRGCAHRCRFCLASYSMLPARGPSLETLLQTIEAGLPHTNKIGLLGALIADHPQFPELCAYLERKIAERIEQGLPPLEISAASLRADTLTPELARTFVKGGQRQLTIAIESGSERLRRRINKNLKQSAIFSAAEAVSTAGLQGLKLYGMVGLPDETDADIHETVQLMADLKKQFPKLQLILGCSSFVPKAWTPFQWMPRLGNAEVDHRFDILQKGLLKNKFRSNQFRPSSTKWDRIQAIVSRGDRRLAPVLVRYFELGSSLGTFNRAYKEILESGECPLLPSADWYGLRERSEHEILPWDSLHLGVDKTILWKESLTPPGFSELN